MVCSSGSRRLAVMARLLDAGSFVSQIGADEVSYHKLAAQNIYRELSEADEANLLDEEESFRNQIMTILSKHGALESCPLDSVNALPAVGNLEIKSCDDLLLQYAYLWLEAYGRSSTFGMFCQRSKCCFINISPLDVSCNACKKPIKASQYAAHADQATPVTDQERSESLDVDDNSSVSVDVKRNSACVNIASAMDGSGVSSENTDHSACVMPPPTKRSKLIAGEHLPLPGDQPTASGVTKTLSSQDAHNCTDFPEQTIPGSVMPSDLDVHKNPEKIHVQQCCLHTQVVYLLEKQLKSSVQTPDQILAQNSEMYLGKSGGYLPTTNFSNQFQADNIPRSQSSTVGLTSKYLPKAYSFAGNSGLDIRFIRTDIFSHDRIKRLFSSDDDDDSPCNIDQKIRQLNIIVCKRRSVESSILSIQSQSCDFALLSFLLLWSLAAGNRMFRGPSPSNQLWFGHLGSVVRFTA
ncbi:Sgf11 (transcriptional regulation protein) protein [Citrus sinensis]|nr:Sgf11 (transcriptional regulation protein) protein [Citrus sinensis]